MNSLHKLIHRKWPQWWPVKCIFIYFFSSQTAASEDDEYDDVTVNQMLAPKTHETDATQILNNLLKEYDKKLRPDIGGEWFCRCEHWAVHGTEIHSALQHSALLILRLHLQALHANKCMSYINRIYLKSNCCVYPNNSCICKLVKCISFILWSREYSRKLH